MGLGKHDASVNTRTLDPPRLSIVCDYLGILIHSFPVTYIVATTHLWLLKLKIVEMK